MRKSLALLASMLFVANAALADDYDKPGFVVNAESELVGITVGTGASTEFSDEAYTIDVHTGDSLPAVAGFIVATEGSNRDYRLYVNKSVEVFGGNSASIVVTPEVSYTTGDTFAKDELKVGPTLYASYDLQYVKPFAEVGFSYKSMKGDFLDFSRADSHSRIGVEVPIPNAPNIALSLAVVDERDADFNKVDRELVTTLSVRF